MKCKAIQNGWLPSQGLITKGDINIEWPLDKEPRGFLIPMDSKDPTEDMTREQVISELKRLNIPFFKGARIEQLQALLMSHKGVV